MASSQNIGIYINNFDTQCPDQKTLAQLTGYASDIGSAGYTTGIFWAMHLNAYGDFIYNGGYPEPMISKGKLQPGFSYLPGLCSALKSGGNINKLYFSVGGWSCECDFVFMMDLISKHGTGSANPLHRNFRALKSELGIVGIDIDLEAKSSSSCYSHHYDYYTDLLVKLAGMLNSLGMEMTLCPYEDQDFWLECLSGIYVANNKKQLVTGINLQCYAGGAGNTQQQWVDHITQSSLPLGITNAATFVNAGYSTLTTDGAPNNGAPSLIQSNFANKNIPAAQMAAGSVSGWIWNEGQIVSSGSLGTAKEYAQAIINGLNQL